MKTSFKYKSEPLANEKRVLDFQIGVRIFYAFTIIWLGQKFMHLHKIFARDEDLLKPLHWFAQIIFSAHLPLFFYQSVTVLAGFACLYALLKGQNNVYLQIFLVPVLMVLNTLKLSLGYVDHVDHLFLLAHFLLISHKRAALNSLFVKYFQSGLLITYTLAGFYKILGLLYKSIFTSEITWLHPKALYYQTYLFHDDVNKTMPHWMDVFLNLGYLPVLLMLMAVFLQTIAVFIVAQYKLLKYYLVWLLVFHGFNFVFFEINFIYAGITAFCFLFPFSVFIKSTALKTA